MASHIVVGAGPVGRATARLLADAGHSVTLTSRNAGTLDLPGIRTVSLDATEAAALAGIGEGVDTIFMCAMAAYHRWPTDFFPIMDGTVQAAEAVGAKIVIAGNTYGYGERAPQTLASDTPLDPTTLKGTVRAIMWERARRSKAPAIEIRASDYLGDARVTYLALLALPALATGAEVAFVGSVDQIHPWSYIDDVARTLIAASLYQGEWDRAFLAPVQHASVREVLGKIAEHRGLEVPALRVAPAAELEGLGWHEAVELTYQWDRPARVDTSETERLLGVRASSLDEMARATARGAA
ncbi:MAG: NAD(P)H-binding protein [Sphingomonas sp.]|uniref:NAD-dependent epimerase/dehydratase family protein n=1 Tax=Sphingomonas sp. TaxID=28214 RepID=UPI001B2AB745|nr:NAD-dependent epimerase/dehydratase family protein [Sphingomonas sp.]MBO9621545.1 NAD(P)H-binding protein [Sphingomonas sp.]